MKSRNLNLAGCLRWGASLAVSSSSSSSVVLLVALASLLLSLPSSVLPFKAGHVEPVPGSTVMRRGAFPTTGSTGTSGSGVNSNASTSRADILRKLTQPRRGAYDSSMTTAPAPTPTGGFYSQSQSQSVESHERGGGSAPYNRFTSIPSPFSSISSTIPSSDKHHLHQRLHHYQRIQRQGMKPTAPSNLLGREEGPSSQFTSSGRDTSAIYYATGSGDGGTMSSVDAERYSHESDPYKKQSVASLNSVEASHAPSLAVGSDGSITSSKSTSTKSSIKVSGSSSNGISSKNNNKTLTNLPIPATLLPPSYLSLATFKHIDGTLEKSSSNILSRIADFWRNLSKDVVKGNGTNSSSLSLSSAKLDTYTPLVGDGSSSIGIDDEYDDDTENVSLANNHNAPRNNQTSEQQQQQHNARHASGGNGSGEKSESVRGVQQLQANKYISMEDSSLSLAAKHQYLSLDDGEDDEGEEEIIGLGGGNNDHNHVDHHQQQLKQQQPNKAPHQSHNQQGTNSVEDYLTSESSVGLGLDFDNVSGDSSSHSFHEDLFHHTTGTITAVIKDHPHQFHEDLVGSGSSAKQDITTTIQRSQEESARSAANIGISALGVSGPSGASGIRTVGDVKRAENKIWSGDNHFGRHDLIESGEDEEHDFFYGMTIGGFLKRELWTIPLFVLASLNMILIILFEVYVLCRARGQSRRHLFLGQMLLFGLFLCSFLALMFAVHPSIIGCFVGRLGVGITYSLIFSVLMVKCVFLLSLDTGIYLPTSYQGILLFFAVAVQVAIDTQWVIMYPPFLQTVESGRSLLLQCGTSFVQLLYSLSYIGFLVLMVGFLAGRAAYKGVVENYRESVYILITAVVTVPVALSWTVAGWMLQGRHQDACVSFGLVAHSLTTFLIMFMPKGRQLASLDKEAVCFEDQEDQCSGYSPSFFHFKPTTKNYKATLWGDGNLYTTLEPTVSTINPNVFFHRNDFHSGMIY